MYEEDISPVSIGSFLDRFTAIEETVATATKPLLPFMVVGAPDAFSLIVEEEEEEQPEEAEESPITPPAWKNRPRWQKCMTKARSRVGGGNGKFVYRLWYCRDYEHCPRCREYRKAQFMRRAVNALQLAQATGQKLYNQVVSSSRSKGLVTKYGKENCFRMPFAGGTALVILCDKPPLTDSAEITSDAAICALPWDEWIMTKEYGNVSGNLGNEVEVVAEDAIEIRAAVVHSDATTEEQDEAVRRAVEDTKDLAPDNTLPKEELQKQVQEAVDTRTRAYIKHLQELGCEASIAPKPYIERVAISRVSWEIFNPTSLPANFMEERWVLEEIKRRRKLVENPEE